MNIKNIFSHIASNWRAGLTVALVSVPLSISLAVASGATPAMGLITAVWAGLLAAIFGSSNYNIVGPAGALSGLLAGFAITHGAGLMPMLAIVSGVFILVAYFLKLGRYLILVPATVMHGFSLGVGLIIGLGQLKFIFGLNNLPVHEEFIKNIFEAIKAIPQANVLTFLVFALFMSLLFFLLKVFPKIPGAILIVIPGILLGYLSQSGIIPLGIQTLGERFADAQIHLFSITQFQFEWSLIGPALGIAFIAILETLISAKIAGIMTDTRFSNGKEIMGLAIANLGSGLFGGLPATGVFVRTGLNAKSGATHKTSSMINAICVAVISLFLFQYFNFIPMAVIAAILVFASIRMVEMHYIIEYWKKAKREFWLVIITALVMVFIDTIAGLAVGSVLALLFFIEKLSSGQFEMTTNDSEHHMICRYYKEDPEGFTDACDVIVYSMKGELAYLNAEAHMERLEQKIKDFNTLVLRFRELSFIDIEGMHALEHIIKTLHARGKKVYIASCTDTVRIQLEKSEFFKDIQSQGHVFENTRAALGELGFKNL